MIKPTFSRSKIYFLIICCSWVLNLQAQLDTTQVNTSKNTQFTAYIDAYYRMDRAGFGSNNRTSFTNSNQSLQLGMASVKIDQVIGKFAGSLDLGLGKRAEEISYNDQGWSTLVKQGFLSYAPNAKLKFTVGKWATHIGYELPDAYLNRNYSMSYAFSYGPFFHTGVKAEFVLGGKTAMMLGLAEPTDVISAKVQPKMILAQLSTATKNEKLKAYLNYQGGLDKSQFDLVLNGVVNNKWGINYDGTICNIAGNSWTSNAIYFNYDYNSIFGFALRSELFDDAKNVVGVGSSIFQNTFSMNVHFKKLTVIPELRMDNAKDPIFLNKLMASTGTAGSFLIAAVYKF
jgi:hypothetical protein